MQVALIEYARNVAGMEGATSEFKKDSPFPVVGLITEWVDDEGNVETRTEKSDLGGTTCSGPSALPPGGRFQGPSDVWQPDHLRAPPSPL
jgi:CTP synthase (UTP-ammonia lyase)